MQTLQSKRALTFLHFISWVYDDREKVGCELLVYPPVLLSRIMSTYSKWTLFFPTFHVAQLKVHSNKKNAVYPEKHRSQAKQDRDRLFCKYMLMKGAAFPARRLIKNWPWHGTLMAVFTTHYMYLFKKRTLLVSHLGLLLLVAFRVAVSYAHHPTIECRIQLVWKH